MLPDVCFYRGAMYRVAEEIGQDEYLFRYTDPDGVGIMSDQYYTKDFTHQASRALQWLPKPPLRYRDHVSYFTQAGNEKFVQRCLVLFQLHIPEILMTRVAVQDVGEIVYQDKYQVVTVIQ